ncbi:hypothetical protein L195_g018733 [Trifolium pratense]|uniref:Uncharacterized protein n=1 Tax=Trifolium pratense TaxID=57577 RepID=A0A2K3MXL3_TRIPR|nr:hypothetical protein L195_g018733 [Trifolium pratense]
MAISNEDAPNSNSNGLLPHTTVKGDQRIQRKVRNRSVEKLVGTCNLLYAKVVAIWGLEWDSATLDDESPKRQDAIVIVHARQNAQLAMGYSCPKEENLTTAPFLILSSEDYSEHSNRSPKNFRAWRPRYPLSSKDRGLAEH